MSDPHGNTVAGWTAVTIILIGFVLGAVAVPFGNWALFWIGGAGLILLGVIAGRVLQMMGLGQLPRANRPTPPTPAESTAQSTADRAV